MLGIRVTCYATALFLGAFTAFAAPPKALKVPAPTGLTGTPGLRIMKGPDWGSALQPYKAQNHLSAAMNQQLTKEKSSAGGSFGAPGIKNGTVDTIPYFNSWFVTNTRNSVYTYSMIGHSPTAGGTTAINNLLIPLILILTDSSGNPLYVFDPTGGGSCGPGSDISLTEESPIYDATTTYPGGEGLPADTGQFADTQMRAQFHNIRAGNWHTVLATPLNVCTDLGADSHYWFSFVPPDFWAYLIDPVTMAVVGEAVDINYVSAIFENVLIGEEATYGDMPNSSLPVILTDSISAYVPGPSGTTCCVLGFHNAQAGIANPAGILVWAWATFLPPGNIFEPLETVSDLSHEVAEAFNDPFTNTAVAPWVDGSVTFAQGNLEVGDVIEAMQPVDALYPVPLSTPDNGLVDYTVQNVALIDWFTRSPLKGAAYSWPNTNTLSHCAHVLSSVPNWCYGEGSAGFFFGPPY